jgi:hypothetical protein
MFIKDVKNKQIRSCGGKMQNISIKEAGFEGILYPGNGSKEK